MNVVTVMVMALNKEQKELLDRFRTLENNKTTPNIRNFFEKAKNFWKS